MIRDGEDIGRRDYVVLPGPPVVVDVPTPARPWSRDAPSRRGFRIGSLASLGSRHEAKENGQTAQEHIDFQEGFIYDVEHIAERRDLDQQRRGDAWDHITAALLDLPLSASLLRWVDDASELATSGVWGRGRGLENSGATAAALGWSTPGCRIPTLSTSFPCHRLSGTSNKDPNQQGRYVRTQLGKQELDKVRYLGRWYIHA